MKRTHVRRPMRHAASLLASLAVVFSVTACGDSDEVASSDHSVSVLYAGSIATVMEEGLGPAFSAAIGYGYAGEAHGSLGAAQLIRDGLNEPDVFISADPAVNEQVLMGSENDDLVTWYVTFASSALVLGYSPKSPHAEDFEAAANGDVEWYEVLQRPDIQIGRGDPTIDPKGYRTLFLFDLAEEYYGDPEIKDLIGDPLNPDQVLPEVSLLARVETGQFDAGIFYRHEAVAADIPYVDLPPEINLGDPRFADDYARTEYQVPDGERIVGAPILFTITIPETVHDREAAEAFVEFILSSPEQVESFGFGRIEYQIGGDAEQMPPALRELATGSPTP